jgi:hypothetical protein
MHTQTHLPLQIQTQPQTQGETAREQALCVDAPVPTVDKYTPFHKGFPLFPQNYPHPGQTLSTCRIF